MDMKWPPDETIDLMAKDPTIENGITITALEGGNPNKKRKSKTKDEER